MNLQELRQANRQQEAESAKTLAAIHADAEAVIEELEKHQAQLDDIRATITELYTEKEQLIADIDKYKTTQADIIKHHDIKRHELIDTLDRLEKQIRTAQNNYSEEVKKQLALKNDLADEKQELVEREFALEIKIQAFKKEKIDFNLEKRRFAAE